MEKLVDSNHYELAYVIFLHLCRLLGTNCHCFTCTGNSDQMLPRSKFSIKLYESKKSSDYYDWLYGVPQLWITLVPNNILVLFILCQLLLLWGNNQWIFWFCFRGIYNRIPTWFQNWVLERRCNTLFVQISQNYLLLVVLFRRHWLHLLPGQDLL